MAPRRADAVMSAAFSNSCQSISLAIGPPSSLGRTLPNRGEVVRAGRPDTMDGPGRRRGDRRESREMADPGGRGEVEVEDERLQNPATIEVVQGQRISLRVEADVSDEVHVHVYDHLAEVS